MFKYLKEEGYYSDLYDLSTIKECLRIREFWDMRMKDLKDDEIRMGRWGLDLQLYFVKGERYKGKRLALQEWMEADRKRDEKLNRTEEPKGIRCMKCKEAMKVIFHDLFDLNCDSLKVLFFFECSECGKRKGVFDDGQEFVSKGGKLSQAEMDEWNKEDVERKDRESGDQKLLEQYRAEFCLSEAEGEEYILSSIRLKELSNFMKETEQKRFDPDYEKAMKLKRLTIVELEKLLTGVLEKGKYIKMTFDKPMIDRHVIVPLTVQDGDTARKKYDSVRVLQRILKKVLDGTNWRLMSEGISYRLGYLSCRLKGFEQEADLIQIVKSRKS